jgi:hypothetical protein
MAEAKFGQLISILPSRFQQKTKQSRSFRLQIVKPMECIPMLIQHRSEPGPLNVRYTESPTQARIEDQLPSLP